MAGDNVDDTGWEVGFLDKLGYIEGLTSGCLISFERLEYIEKQD